MICRRLSLVLGLVLAGVSAANAYDVGVAKIDVTPTYPIRLSGYNSRTTESEGVEQPLMAKALAIRETADASPLVLITVDTLGVPAAMTEAVAARLLAKHQVPRARVAICASHTHAGPIVAGIAPLILSPPTPPDQVEHIERYTKELTALLGDVAEKAIADLRPARVTHAIGSVDFAMNRRKLTDGRWTGFGDVPEGPVDRGLPTLFVYEPGDEGKLRAVLINYACHCTTLGGKFMKIHADWAGCFQEQWEREHPGTTALVSIGCGADANPSPRSDDLTIVRRHGDDLVREVKRLLKAKQTPLAGELVPCRTEFDLPLAPLPTREEFEKRATEKGPIAAHAKLNLERLDRGESLPTKVPYSVQTWTFGDALAMVFLPGEVVVDYQLRLKREFDAKRLWINAYADDAPCYIASKRVLAEGGYEVDGSMYYYDKPQHFAPEVENLIVDAAHEVVPRSFDAATRFAGEIAKIKEREQETPPPVGGILFIGSSTIRMWKLDRWFSDLPAVNHGFGGSQIADSIYYFDDLVMPLKPRQIVFFAGGNDLNAGKTPEQVHRDFVRFATLVRTRLPETRLTYLAITPSVKRWSQIERQREYNALAERTIAEWNSPNIEFVKNAEQLLGPDGQPQPTLYIADGLHLNDAGYEILSGIVRPHLK